MAVGHLSERFGAQRQCGVELAVKACETSYWGDPRSSAFWRPRAKRGEFDDAVTWQTKALANPQYAQEKSTEGKAMLKLFQEHKPWRQK